MRRLITLLILLGLYGGAGFAPVAADEEQDIAAATARAKQIFRLANQERYNAMYDLIHPDAHAVVPRVVAVNTFQELYALADVGRAEITEVTMGPWTWGVTGQTYDSAAHVDFEQPFVEDGEEKILQDTMYLVEGESGDWRWFFGGTPEFVELAIETFGEGTTTETGGTPLVEGDLVNNTINDLDRFYRESFNYTETEYVTPGVVLVETGDSEMTACGPAQTGFWAFYCPLDQTVYLDEAFLAELGKKFAFAAAFVIAHEWAHHIQTVLGLERVQTEAPDEWNEVYSIELELMADCMSGAWAQDVNTRGLLRTGDIDETMAFTIQYLGDPEYIDEYDPQAHGSAEQRRTSFENGYKEGYLACNIVI
jgi:predicted metalloprotease